MSLTNKPTSDEEAEYITPAEASRIVFLSPKSLSRLADEGKIRSIRPGVHRRYLKEDVAALLDKAAS